MKSTLITLAVLFTTLLSAQTKNEVDSRLLENHGDEIYSILEYRKDYYKFLLFELDNGYEILDSDEVNGVQLISLNDYPDFDLNEIHNLTDFNFMKYNFVRGKETHTYVDLGDGKVLKIIGQKELWQAFRDSGLNNKN
jgi:hypothetical protein